MSSDKKRNNHTEMAGLRPGDVFTAEISGYTHDGWGVARLGQRVIFIQGALRGELVQAEISSQRRGVFYARLLQIVQSAPENRRQSPLCPVYDGCGGCQLQHMTYAEELYFKQEQVVSALQRLGGFSAAELSVMRPIIAAAPKQLYHYRNKGIFHVSRDAAGYSLSFWNEETHSPAAAACQLLFPEKVNQLIARLRQGDLPNGVSDVMLRYSFASQRLMLFLRFSEASAEQLAVARIFLQQISAEFADLLVWGVQTPKGWQTFSPVGFLTDTLGNVHYQIAPEAFFQVNNAQTMRLLSVLQTALSAKTEFLLDAYCGIGTLGIYLARHLPGLRRLWGIELNASAVENARQNAELNQLANAKFWQGKAENEFDKILKQNHCIDAVIIDPPRRGCHKQLLHGLLQLRPKQLVYVSCNPSTLARDLQLLCAEKYTLSLVQPVDMFPRTHHVETICLLSRIK